MEIIQAIETYQVPGCLSEFDKNNYTTQQGAVGWEEHRPATYISGGVGKIFLGMPTGFNRMGVAEEMPLNIFKDFEQYSNYYKLPFNIPVWKHLDKYGNTLVRGLMPRRNLPFICVILENCIGKIECFEVTESLMKTMD